LKLRRIKKKIPMNLFFVELLVVLAFFSVAAAVILRMFVAADRNAVRAALTEGAMLDVQSFSEMYAMSGDMKKAADTVYGAECLVAGADGSSTVVLDEDGDPLITEDGRRDYGVIWITMYETTENTNAGKYSETLVTVFLKGNDAQEIYRHTCSAYIPSFAVREEENGGAAQ